MKSHKILRIVSPSISLQNTLAKELGISKNLAQVLINRKINSVAEAEKFLNVKTSDFLNPYNFLDMHKAVALIRKAAEDRQRVMVFGDYDVDGVTSTALLKDVFSKMGIEVEHYLPHRIKEGYGLAKNIVQVAKERRIGLLVTADCGTSNHKEIEELRRNNIGAIITDHHQPQGADLPAALAVINPKISDCGYKYKDLAGVGVAYKLCQALKDSLLLEELDLVSLGTIADSVPLTGENRIIATEGLQRLPDTKRPGLKALIQNAGLEDKKFSSTSVSFMLGPRINASGRMASADTSLQLLLSDKSEQADELVKLMEGYNRQRQKIEAKILEEAEDMINRDVNFKEHKIIVIAKEDWHQGVLGIVASKLADRFSRPAIVISVNKDFCKGSARSTKNFHLFNALMECKQLLSAFGGHSHAAGLVITENNIDEFRRSINKFAHERLTLEDLLPSVEVDMELLLADLSREFVRELERLEPFGTANPEPLFFTKELMLKGQPQTLSRDTLKFWATDNNYTYQVIGFGMGSFKESLLAASSFDLVYTPRIDDWRGGDDIILEAKDIFLR